MFKVALSNLVSHKFRSIALVLTIVLGVSFVVGTYVLTDTVTEVFDDIFTDAYSTVDVNVRSTSELGIDAARTPVPESLVVTVRAVPGVAAAEGDIFGVGVEILGQDGERVGAQMAPALATSWAENDELTPLVLREGRKPSGINEVAIDATSFEEAGVALGQPIRLVTPVGPRTFTLVGVATFGSASNIAGATLAVFDLPAAQQIMQRAGTYDSINVKAADGVDEDALQDRVAAALPPGYEAVTSKQLTNESNEALDEGLTFFKTFLLVFAFIALFVGAFIIYNTFGIVVTQRTREFALLRALGASSRQVLTSIVGESVVLGAVASAIGLGAGVLLAVGLKALLAAIGFEVPSGSLVLLPRTALVAMVGGTGITVVSAVAPAIRASRVPPLAAMNELSSSRRGVGIRRNVLGVVLTIVGVVLVTSGLTDGTLTAVGIGAPMTFLGVAMLAPLFAKPVTRAVGFPVSRLRGIPAELARQNAMRSSRRTAATASALMVGTALMAGSLILSTSITRSVERSVTRGALADLVIRSESQLPFSGAVADEISSVAGVAATQRYRIGTFKIGNATKQLSAVNPEAIDVDDPRAVLDIDVSEGDVTDLATNAIAVRSQVARDRDWSVGQTVSVTFPSGVRDLVVAALYEENALAGDYVVSLTTFEQNFADDSDFLVLLRLEPGADLRSVQGDVRARIEANYPSILVEDRDEYVGAVKEQINQFLSLITALLALAVIIALLGVLITMLLAVFERTHELGLLRAVGMSRRQMRSMVRWEAAMVSIYGALLGVGLGVFFGLALSNALRDQGVSVVVVPVASLIGLAALIAALGVLAAVYPARRAARLNILDAVAHA